MIRIIRHIMTPGRSFYVAGHDAIWDKLPNCATTVWTHPVGRNRYFVAYE